MNDSEVKRWLAGQASAGDRAIQVGLMGTLDGLNAFGMLENAAKRSPSKLLAYGPQDVRGSSPQVYAGVVIWHRPKGYRSYKSLTLLGIWAAQMDGETRILVGERRLSFQASHYNAESVFHHLKRTFTVHYGKSAPPPEPQHRLIDAAYQPESRLKTRQQVAAVVGNYWRG